MGRILAMTGVTALLLSAAPAFAATSPGLQRWETQHNANLCSDYSKEFKDAAALRPAANIPKDAQSAATDGRALCHHDAYAAGAGELKTALNDLGLSAQGSDVDQVD